MIEYVMRYNIDETGKMINARRMEELVRCKNCRNFGFCKDHGCKDNDFCSYANKKVEHYCNNCRQMVDNVNTTKLLYGPKILVINFNRGN